MIARDTERLGELVAKLKPINRESGILSDLYEAAADWCSLGNFILKRQPWEDLRALSMENEEQREGILAFHGDAVLAAPDFAEIMERGARVIAAGKLVIGDPRGYLGCNDIIRDTFGFLVTEHGFVWEDGGTTWPGYVRGPLKIELDWPFDRVRSLLELRSLAEPTSSYEVADILYMTDRNAPLEPQARPKITTEPEAQAAYTAMADLLRQHCADILADVPGAFERLAAASIERYRRLGEHYDRLNDAGKLPK